MSTRTQSVPARTERPEGQPGTVRTSHRHYRGNVELGVGYPAVQARSGVTSFWRDTTDDAAHWIVAPRALAESFEAGPEWQSRCKHIHGAAWRTCFTEVDCIALDREDERKWGR
jgi:hypothetical protein